MAIGGAIAERVRGIIPVTWDALSLDRRFGDALLQAAVDTAKEAVFGKVIALAAEQTYSLVVINFVAKVAALELIPAGMDLWANMEITTTTQNPTEAASWVDRADKLKQLRDILVAETRADQIDIAAIVGHSRITRRGRPKSNTTVDLFLTPSPQEFPRPYRQTAFS